MRKILVVDDESVSRRLVGGVLEQSGDSVIYAASGDRALAVLEDNPDVQLVITDYMMEGFSGRDLVNVMRKNAALCKIPVILVSGIVKLSEIHDLLEHGVDRFMPKPIHAGELREYVQQLTEKTED